MAEIAFRITMIFLVIILGIYLTYIGLFSTDNINEKALIGVAICMAFLLLLWPLWPDEHILKIVRKPLEKYPTLAAFSGYLILSFSGFFLAWGAATHQMHLRGILGVLYGLSGPVGVAMPFSIFGFIGIAGCINALRKKS